MTSEKYYLIALLLNDCFIAHSQALMRLTHANYAEDFQWTISFILDLYKINSKIQSRDRFEYFQKISSFTEILFKVVISTIACSFFVFLFYPIYMYFFQGQLIPIVPLFLPGIDENTLIGYTVVTIYHLALAFVGMIGFSSFEFLIAIIIISSLIFAKLISIDLVQINADLKEKNPGSVTVKGRLLNVFLMHQQMDELVIQLYSLHPLFI